MAPVHCSAVSLLGGDWSIPATYAAELFSARGCARLGTASPSASQSSSFPHVVARGRGQRHHKRRSRALSCTWLCEARGQRHLAPIKCFALFEPPASMRHLCSNGTRPTPASLLVLGMDYVIVLHSRAHRGGDRYLGANHGSHFHHFVFWCWAWTTSSCCTRAPTEVETVTFATLPSWCWAWAMSSCCARAPILVGGDHFFGADHTSGVRHFALLVLGMDYVIVLYSRAHLDRWRPFLWCRPHLRRSPLCPPGVGHG